MEKKDYKLFFKSIIKEALMELLSDEQILSKIKKNLKQEGVSSEPLNLKESVRPQTRKIDPKILGAFQGLEFNPLAQIKMAKENPEIKQLLKEAADNGEFDRLDEDDGLEIEKIQQLMKRK